MRDRGAGTRFPRGVDAAPCPSVANYPILRLPVIKPPKALIRAFLALCVELYQFRGDKS